MLWMSLIKITHISAMSSGVQCFWTLSYSTKFRCEARFICKTIIRVRPADELFELLFFIFPVASLVQSCHFTRRGESAMTQKTGCSRRIELYGWSLMNYGPQLGVMRGDHFILSSNLHLNLCCPLFQYENELFG